jgi:para-nitrobenzyl esterase
MLSDETISNDMSTYWTNFAKYRDPNGNGLPQWPTFGKAKDDVMYFAQKPNVGEVPGFSSFKVLDEYFKWRSTPEGEAWVIIIIIEVTKQVL